MIRQSILLASLTLLPLAGCAPSYVQKGRTQAVSYPLPSASVQESCAGDVEANSGAYGDALLGTC